MRKPRLRENVSLQTRADSNDVGQRATGGHWGLLAAGVPTAVSAKLTDNSHLTCDLHSVTYCNATMPNTPNRRPRALGELEQLLMEFIWSRGASTAEACREGLLPVRALKDSTIRTVLRRLEEKGLLKHEVEGRTFLYQATQPPRHFAARAVQHIIDRFCGGSVEQLLAGMVESDVLKQEELEALVQRIAQRGGEEK